MGHSVRGLGARWVRARALPPREGVRAAGTPARLRRPRRLIAKVGRVGLARDAQAPQRHVRLVRVAFATSRTRDGRVNAARVLVAGPQASELLNDRTQGWVVMAEIGCHRCRIERTPPPSRVTGPHMRCPVKVCVADRAVPPPLDPPTTTPRARGGRNSARNRSRHLLGVHDLQPHPRSPRNERLVPARPQGRPRPARSAACSDCDPPPPAADARSRLGRRRNTPTDRHHWHT